MKVKELIKLVEKDGSFLSELKAVIANFIIQLKAGQLRLREKRTLIFQLEL